jgi:hypothetical protein
MQYDKFFDDDDKSPATLGEASPHRPAGQQAFGTLAGS